MTTIKSDIEVFTALSIGNYAMSAIGSAFAQGYTVTDLGVSANRTLSALESSTPKVANAVAGLIYDLVKKGVV